MRLRLLVTGALVAAAVATGCENKGSGPTPPDANTGTKELKDKSGKVRRGGVDDSFADPNYKK